MAVRREQTLPISRPTMDRRFGLLGDSIRVETNHPDLLAAAEASFGRFAVPDDGQPLTLRLILDGDRRTDHAGLSHRTAGHHYLVTAPGSAAVADLLSATATAFVDRATMADQQRLRYTYIEGPALAMATLTRGYLVLHASGVARGGTGVALHGPEGAGKSTLAVACARRGLDVFAEDGVFVRAGPAGLEFWGMPWIQRLLPDARGLFPELADIEPRLQANSELKLEVELDRHYPGRARPSAAPAAIVLLERAQSGRSSIEPLDESAKDGAVAAQWPWEPEWGERHDQAAELLAQLPVYRLKVSGGPDEAVDLLVTLFDELGPWPVQR